MRIDVRKCLWNLLRSLVTLQSCVPHKLILALSPFETEAQTWLRYCSVLCVSDALPPSGALMRPRASHVRLSQQSRTVEAAMLRDSA